MATYPIKMLKDEHGQLFIPLTNSDSVVTTTGDTLEELIDTKVDKVTGKGLSTNDYTTAEKQKLAGLNNYELPKASSSTLGGIKVGTNLSINSDGVLSADAQQIDVDSALSGTSENPVQNKIVKNALDDKVDKVSGKGLSTNDYTTDEKNKLAGIAAGAEVNVNANWNAVSGDAQILNKPTKVSAFTNDAGYTSNTGTVTSVGLTAGGGISISGSPVTTSGSITVEHSNSITAQTTSGLYPIKIDAQGHITQYGEAYEVATTEEIKTMLQEMGLDIYVVEPTSPTDYIYSSQTE